MKEFEIVTELPENSPADYGFNVRFDRPYLITEHFPISEDAAMRAIDDAYDWMVSDSRFDPREIGDGVVVGKLIVDDSGKYIETRVVE